MMVDNIFVLLIITSALVYSGFARLPLMVIANVLMFICVGAFIESSWDVSLTPGYEIYYVVGCIYFLVMALIFNIVKDKFYKLIAIVMLVHAGASAAMLVWDSFYLWHEAINDNMLTIQCILVWLSSVRKPCKQK
jgi:TRAP-type C4-dicarboxylate transport system permease small subunit